MCAVSTIIAMSSVGAYIGYMFRMLLWYRDARVRRAQVCYQTTVCSAAFCARAGYVHPSGVFQPFSAQPLCAAVCHVSFSTAAAKPGPYGGSLPCIIHACTPCLCLSLKSGPGCKLTGHELNEDIQTFDASCFDGKYVTGDIDEEYMQRLEGARGARGRGAQEVSLFKVQPQASEKKTAAAA